LYALKGEVVSRGIKAVTGFEMPVFEKRRFQEGAVPQDAFLKAFGASEIEYRTFFHSLYA
jgi:asparagine synthase (glutamine-hydrolysing)